MKIVGTPLLQFCNDQELNEWFDSLETDFPESMEYWIFGEAPYAMEFTDPELIMAAAKALLQNTELSAEEIAEKALRIAAGICVYTNDHITVLKLDEEGGLIDG